MLKPRAALSATSRRAQAMRLALSRNTSGIRVIRKAPIKVEAGASPWSNGTGPQTKRRNPAT
jgi:hypothetical protein